MKATWQNELCGLLKADSVRSVETIQTLWSGYGSLDRVRVAFSDREDTSVIVKRMQTASSGLHPRGWQTELSHQRKLESYKIERHWYLAYAHKCPAACRVAECLGHAIVGSEQQETILVLEDLDSAGYGLRHDRVSLAEFRECLKWLAHFHAFHLNHDAHGLWARGTYWHLDTRPDELAMMESGELKQAAANIDQVLGSDPYPTLVHGDAKLANFCFTGDSVTKVAAVDFQYVGRGCAMSDVAYCLSSAFEENDLDAYADGLLDDYFVELQRALAIYQPAVDGAELESVWRKLYSLAWADFARFLQGWCPGHWKLHGYSLQQVTQALEQCRGR